jgi:hypothetical protein
MLPVNVFIMGDFGRAKIKLFFGSYAVCSRDRLL